MKLLKAIFLFKLTNASCVVKPNWELGLLATCVAWGDIEYFRINNLRVKVIDVVCDCDIILKLIKKI